MEMILNGYDPDNGQNPKSTQIPNRYNPKSTQTDPEWTQVQLGMIPNGHNPELTRTRKDATSNGHYPEWTIPNGTLPHVPNLEYALRSL